MGKFQNLLELKEKEKPLIQNILCTYDVINDV